MKRRKPLHSSFVSISIFLSILVTPSFLLAHGHAGKRFFPTTFEVDDPFISDEFSILVNRDNGPDAHATALDIEYSKRILPEFGFEFQAPYLRECPVNGDPAAGWDNLAVGAKWQFLTNDTHEMIFSIGTDIDIGGTGSHRSAEPFSTISPTFFFGKGFGDLPESMRFLRPVAVTGTIGLNFPTRRTNVRVKPDTSETESERNPTFFPWGFTLQYNIRYLQSFVKDIGLKDPFKRMLIVAEFPMQTCISADCSGGTTGTVNSGVIWAAKRIELGIAAQIPVNSRSGNGVGILGLIHFFVDDLLPKSLGRPIFR